MDWISFFHKVPDHDQQIYYYGQYIGVWLGHYEYHIDDSFSPHIIICDESPGVVDRMDVPWWMPYYGQPKPQKPKYDYPIDYPSYA